MGLLNRRSNEHARTGTTGTHHPARDGIIAGGVAHHEANNHPTRDAALAGGAVGEGQHLRNKHQTAATGTQNPYEHGNANVGAGYGGIHKNREINGTTPMGSGTTGTAGATGAAATTGVGPSGAHTGPAPLGPNAPTNPASTTRAPAEGTAGGQSATAPTLRQAAKLERKGKLESTLSHLTCSSNMRHKANTHLAQADHLRMQASELGEAERLETEAGMRRQRAVGLGADTEHATGTTGFGHHGAGAGMGANRTTAVT
ncbi:hypothetical protein M231_07744 [Tremella mesenterica]|uniref:Uncharacterized protein n=1 Tax=Tremella mesenterica TaxID=5217 RepID=A0A4V1M2Y5_TREME|nr:hypothetical protein M231_07744 [Tremella mesenterica]